ncbi:phospholipid scramblase 2-like isoform X1 [Cavia porcellus]|uniref:phospholipid scramblase 2-like isoform X1 n=1 Tax=Cavia porcellus TaxID=10141 RepID=UPI002FE2821B
MNHSNSDTQKYTPHPAKEQTAKPPPCCPSLEPAGSSTNTGHFTSEKACQVPEDLWSPESEDSGPQHAHLGHQTGASDLHHFYQCLHAGYLDHKGAYLGSHTSTLYLEASSSATEQAGFPVQKQPECICSSVPKRGLQMPAQSFALNRSSGLECLNQVDLILVNQQMTPLKGFSGFQTNNEYEIKDRVGQKLFSAMEDTHPAIRNCFGKYRPFTMRITDNMGREVATLERPLRCDCFCFPCYLQKLEIQAPPGVPIGYVIQKFHTIQQKFIIQNEKKEDVLTIIGFCIRCTCCTDINFEVKSLDEKYIVGKITKNWSGVIPEFLTDVDNFMIQFYVDLDVKMKAVILGACFLIDFMYFEKSTLPICKWI